MSTTYDDIIRLKSAKPAYNIKNEEPDDWKIFIVNPNFDNFLSKVIASVRNNDSTQHKSFWVSGTYGTGKSHACAVVKHLLCDPCDKIEKFLFDEYGDKNDLTQGLLAVRKHKRLFPVNIYGSAGISSIDDLSLKMQSEIIKALNDTSISIGTLKTDFDDAAAHIENNSDVWNLILQEDKISAYVGSCNELISKLQEQDSSIYALIKEALDARKMAIKLSVNDLSNWLTEAQEALRASTNGEYDGFLIVWDEFTEVMNSNIGTSILDRLQPIAENLSNSANDSYFLFISHPSALDGLENDKKGRTLGRYHVIRYNMESMSAYKIMSHRFEVIDKSRFDFISANFFNNSSELVLKYANGDSNSETWKNLKNLYPIHPSTANLATHYATVVGSNTRSVFEFFADDIVKQFFASSQNYRSRAMLTADYLWDYIYLVLLDAPAKYSAVTEKFKTFKTTVEQFGENYSRVFKSILLLNALNNASGGEEVSPSTQNIELLFAGTSIAQSLHGILSTFDKQGIIQRDPNGIYSIRFSSLPPNEIEDLKIKMKDRTFSSVLQILDSCDIKSKVTMPLKNNLWRPYDKSIAYIALSKDDTKHSFYNKIEKGLKDARDFEIKIVFLFAKNQKELQTLHSYAGIAAQDSKYSQVSFVVIETPLTDDQYNRFIEYRAHAECAGNHQQAEMRANDIKSADTIVKQWIEKISSGTCLIYFRQQAYNTALRQIGERINTSVSPVIFYSGPESLAELRKESTKTYWAEQMARKTSERVLMSKFRQNIVSDLKSNERHVKVLLENSVDENMEIKEDISNQHPIYLVQSYIDSVLDAQSKNTKFHMGEVLKKLSEPPFGLYPSHACITLVAYAMRKYIDRLFYPTGQEVGIRALKELVTDMFSYWRENKRNLKLEVMLESGIARDLCQKLIDVFELTTKTKYKNITSLKEARWSLNDLIQGKKFPLWSLKYITNNATLVTLIDNLVSLCSAANSESPSQELIQKVLNGLEDLTIDFLQLLHGEDNFKIGFINYIKAIEETNIQEHEVDNVLRFIELGTQGQVSTITESEVKSLVVRWKIQSSVPVTTEATPTVTPVATPTVTPVATPTVTPVATPTVTPVTTPAVTPVATPTVTPVTTPTVTPAATLPNNQESLVLDEFSKQLEHHTREGLVNILFEIYSSYPQLFNRYL